MDMIELARKYLSPLDPRLVAWLERRLKRVPAVQAAIEKEFDHLLGGLDASLHPYRGQFARQARLPEQGRSREAVLAEMRALRDREAEKWRAGRVSGAVYHGQDEHVDFLNQVYALHSQSNPLHSDVWPSAAKFEAEMVSMTAHMLNAPEVCGAVTSGGTESILLAMKTYRDQARETRGIRQPEIVAPVTAHTAFDKAAQYFGLRLRRTPLGADFRADVAAMRRAVNRNTVALVASAPAFPHGLIDPVAEIAELARARGLGCHVDACLGGFVLPWAEKLGYPVPPFDFRLPGVTSMSADTHKYGYAAKGTSIILYRTPELRRFQYFTAADWPGGLYFSPTIAGSRPGGLSAAGWAAMVTLGEAGYLEAARRILETAAIVRRGLGEMPDLQIVGDPLWIIAFTSRTLDVYRVLDAMGRRGWSLNGLHRPPAVHIALTLRHAQPGVAERLVEDVRDSVAEVRTQPAANEGMAPVYGLAGTLPLRGVVGDLLRRYIDILYKV